jgi:NAD(P)-dependent dehydrogenase (short-subunit alcohol dehydrogenase family)
MDMGLQDKVVLVTGGNSGIGAETTRRLAEEGAKVAVHALKTKDAEAQAARLGRGATGFHGDLADSGVCDRLVGKVVRAFGRIDGLVNNAGIFPRTRIEQASAEAFDRMFAINARAPMLLVRGAVAAFREQKSGGSIVNIGSINAWCGQPDLVVYSMSKGALMTMTRNLGDALAEENIRVNQVNPGWILTETELATQKAQGRPDGWEADLPKAAAPRGTINRPQEVAEHILFWLSPRSAPATGQVYEMEQYPLLGRLRLNAV